MEFSSEFSFESVVGRTWFGFEFSLQFRLEFALKFNFESSVEFSFEFNS